MDQHCHFSDLTRSWAGAENTNIAKRSEWDFGGLSDVGNKLHGTEANSVENEVRKHVGPYS